MKKLIDAIRSGSRKAVAEVILESQRQGGLETLLDERTSLGETPLMCSIKRGYTKIAETIIALGADVNHVAASTGDTPLIYAVRYCLSDVVEKLISSGANIEARNNEGNTAMDIASLALTVASEEQVEKYEAILQVLGEAPDSILETAKLIELISAFRISDGFALHEKIQLKCTAKIMKSEVDQFKECEETMREFFADDYVSKHRAEGVNSREIFWGLMLNAAITFEDLDLVEYILSIPTQNVQYVLTVVDDNESSALSNALLCKNEQILGAIAKYISVHKQEIQKIECIEEEVDNLKTIVEFSVPEGLTPQECFDQYIGPLFSQESIASVEKLVTLIGE